MSQRDVRGPRRVLMSLALVCQVLALVSLIVGGSVLAAPDDEVVFITARGVVNPALASYIRRGVEDAERVNAVAVVIELDTPGGLDTSMREIVQTIVNARVPVVVYVTPPGARAASAGLFILQAGHIAAMAPSTNVGSAHPVQLGGSPTGGESEPPDPTMTQKVENDAVAFIRSLAERRGRNVEWVETAVRESANVHAREALALNVIDVVAPDRASLLSDIDARTVELADGQQTVLRTKDAAVRAVDMSLTERIIHTITDPNIAFILLTIGVYGLIYELANPGGWVPGVIGLTALIVGLYALGTLQASFVGIAMILLAFILFGADVLVTPGAGGLSFAGTLTLILGAIFLFDEGVPGIELSPFVAAGVIFVTVAFFVFAVGAVARAQRRPVAAGAEAMVGTSGVASTDLAPRGMVHVAGEIWQAVAEAPIARGEPVNVVGREGLTLFVRRASPPAMTPATRSVSSGGAP